MAALLRVLLGELPIGTLALDRNEGCEFRLHKSYKDAYPRLILGQIFLDDPDQVWRSRARLPAWFSNLLPEGPLREMVAARAGVATSREFFLLRLLGEDLPGAVRIVADTSEGEEGDIEIENEGQDGSETGDEWHFSLAGVQLKFSARRSERGLTVPASGKGGDWIVKLPDVRYQRVPANEYATMRWAEASGIPIPEIELIDVGDVSGLPSAIGELPERQALAVRRFDRTVDGRVHMEDFAQILGLYPEAKYSKFNYETQASLIAVLSGEDGLDDFVRRLVFIVASGNGDAHHKNLSLLYPDGTQAKLSPAYDQVSTLLYNQDDKLALNLARSKRWEDVSLDSFRRLARKIGHDEQRMTARVQESVGAIMDAWNRFAGEFGYDKKARGILGQHFRRVPLLFALLR